VNHLFTHRIEVRFRDCDPMGHANNAVYLTYLEQARFAHWRALGGSGGEVQALGGPDRASAPDGVPGVILARVEIDYRKPATYGELLEIKLGIASFGRTSLTYEYELVAADASLVAAARTVVVSFDYRAGKPVVIADTLKEWLGRKLI
jgi:acyl-CoA thioester hydrolase